METTEPREDGETMRAVCDSPRHARAIIRASGAPGGLPDGCIKNQAANASSADTKTTHTGLSRLKP